MFFHILKYRLRCILRQKQFIIWSIIFPIFLATIFKITIPEYNTVVQFEKSKIGIIDNYEYKSNTNFKEAINSVYKNTDDSKNIFDVTLYKNIQDADEALKSNQILGYINMDSGPNVVIKTYGYAQTILQEFVNNYIQMSNQYSQIIAQDPTEIETLINSSNQNQNAEYIKQVSLGSSKPTSSLSYFYALIALTCLYGSFLGAAEIINIQADQSPKGIRVNMAPTSKLKQFASSITAATLMQILVVIILIIYLRYVLNINFGDQIGYVLTVSLIGSLAGVSLGSLIASVVKGNENLKIGMCTGITLFLSFLSGLMWVNIKYIISKNVPILSYINPASLIADSFYTLYYYDTYDKFFINLALLIVFSIICFCLTINVVRRKRYESI